MAPMLGGCMELGAVLPEMILAGLALLLVPVAGWARRPGWRLVPAAAAVVGLIVAMGVTLPMLAAVPREAFCGTYAVDPFRAFYQLLLEGSALVSVLILGSHLRGHAQEAQAPVAVLLATVGGMGLVGSLDLGLIVLFLQMVSFPSYLLAVIVRTDRPAQEASLKYFIYGATALAIMAYGLTFLFGLTGSLNLGVIGTRLAAADPAWVALALGLVLVGYGFEITLVPFHVWSPDVLEGSPAPSAGFIAVVPKIAAFGGLLRLLAEVSPNGPAVWPLAMALLAAATMTLGNLAALGQRSLKRLLAYSSIAQAGYMTMAVAVSGETPGARDAVGFYLLAYLLMNLAAFLVVAQVERRLGGDDMALFRGLGRGSPWAAAVLSLALLSLAGIPPLAGFAGKILLLSAAIDGGMSWLALVGAANMAIGLFYYARVIAEMYFRPADGPGAVAGGRGYTAAAVLTTAGTVLLGVLPALGLTPAAIGARLLH